MVEIDRTLYARADKFHPRILLQSLKIEGLPKQFWLIGTFPEIGKPYELTLGDRGSEAAVIIQQNNVLEKNLIYTVEVHRRIVYPKELSDWLTRVVSFDILDIDDINAELDQEAPKGKFGPRRTKAKR